jgi:hypothetical protein
LDKETKSSGQKESISMHMLFGGMGGQAFCYTFLLLSFVCFEMGPARVGIPRHESLFSSTGNGSKTLDSVSLFSCWWTDPLRAFYGRLFSRIEYYYHYS